MLDSGLAALWHCMRKGYAFWIMQEFCHRLWNDVFWALKHAQGYPYQYVLMFTIIFNLPYGPFGSGVWHQMLLDSMKSFVETEGHTSELFQEAADEIAADLEMSDPRNDEDMERLLSYACSQPGVVNKGSHVKVSRWASFFEAAREKRGSLHFTKMLLQWAKCQAGGSYDDLQGEAKGNPGTSAAKQGEPTAYVEHRVLA